MKKEFVTPEVEIYEIKKNNVIATSDGGSGDPMGGGGE